MRHNGGNRRKKTFDCGHRGLGQHCHRCAQAELWARRVLDSKWALNKDYWASEIARLRSVPAETKREGE